MSEDTEGKLPQRTTADWGHTIAKTVISAVPLMGNPAAELFDAVIAPPLAKRRDRWLESLAEGLRALEEKVSGFSVAELSNNEAFVTAVTHASSTAIKNHQKDKLEALRNAVLNSALPNPPEVDIQLMFLGWVDTLTPLHIRILMLLSVPTTWGTSSEPEKPGGATGLVSNVIQHAFPELRGQRAICNKVVKDLTNDGLLDIPKTHVTKDGAVFASEPTALGSQFLSFIAPPDTGAQQTK